MAFADEKLETFIEDARQIFSKYDGETNNITLNFIGHSYFFKKLKKCFLVAINLILAPDFFKNDPEGMESEIRTAVERYASIPAVLH